MPATNFRGFYFKTPKIQQAGAILFDTANMVVIFQFKGRSYYFMDPCKVTKLLMDAADVYVDDAGTHLKEDQKDAGKEVQKGTGDKVS